MKLFISSLSNSPIRYCHLFSFSTSTRRCLLSHSTQSKNQIIKKKIMKSMFSTAKNNGIGINIGFSESESALHPHQLTHLHSPKTKYDLFLSSLSASLKSYNLHHSFHHCRLSTSVTDPLTISSTKNPLRLSFITPSYLPPPLSSSCTETKIHPSPIIVSVNEMVEQ